MSARETLVQEADANQARASDPSASAWVSANAGTGKTAVLVKRALRLLLAGSMPESILCLTYTKTAAAEMQNRLLAELAAWAALPEEALRERLCALTGQAPESETLDRGQRLFTRTLEAKGGLKIYTIHGFCERLLQRFPLEAGVTPHFAVLDERAQAELRQAAFEAAIARAAKDKDSTLGQALNTIVALTGDFYFRKVIDALLSKRAELARLVAHHDGRPDWAEAEGSALKQLLGVAGEAEEALIEAQATVLSDDEIGEALAALQAFATKKTDREAAKALAEAMGGQGEERAAALKRVFLTEKNEPRARVVTGEIATAAPGVAAKLDAAQAKFAALTHKLVHLRLAEASAAVLALAEAVLTEYERRKEEKTALDYDDLIAKAQSLLSRSNAAAWVLYKIDGGVDHILVDEAQDTNPAQWNIVETLAAEFFAGASERLRTLFAVGDEKQSIYSFQGADPARFGEVGRAFRTRAAAIDVKWHDVPLNLSFRSAEPILAAVDHVFAQETAANGLTGQETAVIKHHAFRKGDAGLVEIWDVIPDERAEPADAFEPWNERVAGARSVDQLCERIAVTIRGWLDKGEPLPARGRAVRPGDILILVRRRDPFTTPMIRALKRSQIPVAGADRMLLMDQLAVQDLVALADVLLMPNDDLALAVVLKSPLFGLDDDALFSLAYGRKGSLWEVLKAKAATDPRFAEAEALLSRWLSRADYLPPYEFFSELLGADGQRMRKAMLGRLGPEAAEAIDEFLDRALAYDREAAPSLQGFVNHLRAGDVEIKRDMEQGRDEVRIMTVHGAKGLQAPIVFLPDTCTGPRPQGPRIFSLPRAGEAPGAAAHLLWPPSGEHGLTAIAPAKEAAKQADGQEHNRLLYVAMTRAEDRLYICGWEGQRSRDKNCWYDLIEKGLGPHLTRATDGSGHSVRRMECPQTKAVEGVQGAAKQPALKPLPDWARKPAPTERARAKLAPSRLAPGVEGGVEALGPEQAPLGPLALSANKRYARGRLMHALLQHLPEVEPEAQERAARLFVAARGAELSQELREEIVTETLAIVTDATFAPLFRPGSIAEVPIVARIGHYDLEGRIDRLVVADGRLLILDYKTNRPPPETVEEVAPAYIDQLAAYRLALKRLYPGRGLHAALLWTDGPRLMPIPSTSLDEAEARLLAGCASLDGTGPRT